MPEEAVVAEALPEVAEASPEVAVVAADAATSLVPVPLAPLRMLVMAPLHSARSPSSRLRPTPMALRTASASEVATEILPLDLATRFVTTIRLTAQQVDWVHQLFLPLSPTLAIEAAAVPRLILIQLLTALLMTLVPMATIFLTLGSVSSIPLMTPPYSLAVRSLLKTPPMTPPMIPPTTPLMTPLTIP